MSFVRIEKNENSVPSNSEISTAMTYSGGKVISITGDNASKRVDYDGTVNHTRFESELRTVAGGRSTSWNYAWADGSADVVVPAEPDLTPYEIDITMTQGTVTALESGKYSLFGFKAVQATQGGGAPLVWFQLPATAYSNTTRLTWTEQYKAYTSTDTAISSGQVEASFDTDISLGQTLGVVAGGFGDVTSDGPAHAISIQNTVTTQFTCGIAQQAVDGSVNPMCAFPLYGNQLDVIAPIEKVLLMFSTTPVNTGTVIEQAYSPGVLIDLTTSSLRSLSYDINTGWAWGGFSWGQPVAANDSLIPLLIENVTGSVGASVRRRALVLG